MSVRHREWVIFCGGKDGTLFRGEVRVCGEKGSRSGGVATRSLMYLIVVKGGRPFLVFFGNGGLVFLLLWEVDFVFASGVGFGSCGAAVVIIVGRCLLLQPEWF